VTLWQTNSISSIFSERNVIVATSPYNLKDVLQIVDQIDVRGMHERDRVDVRQQVIVRLEGVGRHLQDHRVLGRECLARPPRWQSGSACAHRSR